MQIGTGTDTQLVNTVRKGAYPITGAEADYDPLLNLIGDARIVMIGEASHGTHEFYRERAEITKRLITEKDFTAVTAEADWPDAYRINRYVQGRGDGATAIEALADFVRFPMWMWRNTVVLDFVGWLRSHNENLSPGTHKTGFYGLDLYSMYTSMGAVLKYLDSVDPEAAKRARYRYSCLEDFGEDTQAYGYSASFGLTKPCEDDAVNQLIEMQSKGPQYSNMDGRVAEDEYFFAEQNARLVKNAEEYYRTMFTGRVSSWNLRDRHMADTVDALLKHLDRQGGRTKAVVWAHNSHLGDARATQMGAQGEWNVGQLVRERYGKESLNIGFCTYTGTVTAADDWDAPAKRKRVRPGLAGSYEELMHEAGVPHFMLLMRENRELTDALKQPRLERAIGVIYRPETERLSHYFDARLSEQFDVYIHIDETRALEPLDRTSVWDKEETPETYPFGQ